jgi:hypothetical protein
MINIKCITAALLVLRLSDLVAKVTAINFDGVEPSHNEGFSFFPPAARVLDRYSYTNPHANARLNILFGMVCMSYAILACFMSAGYSDCESNASDAETTTDDLVSDVLAADGLYTFSV